MAQLTFKDEELQSVIDKLMAKAIETADTSNTYGYKMDDGTNKIDTAYRSVAEIVSDIKAVISLKELLA